MSSFQQSINNLKNQLSNKNDVKIKKPVKPSKVVEFNFANSDYNGFDKEFNNMKNKWMSLYEDDSIEKFTLVFKTDDSDFSIPIQYVYHMHVFLSELKGLRSEKPLKYSKLSQTIITIKSGNLRFLLNMLFKLISPFSNVYIVSNDKSTDNILNYVKKSMNIPNNLEDVTYIPGGSTNV